MLLSSTAHAQALKAETMRLSSLVGNASVFQRDPDADVLSAQRELLDDTTDADAARLADSLAELAAGRKADDANVKERTVALKAEFAAIVAELARVEKKHASKFAKLTAAADTMRAETEDAAAAQQRRADSLAEDMLRQTNHQQTSHEAMRLKVQCTVEQLHQTEFERRADAKRLLEQLRPLDVLAARSEMQRLAEAFRRVDMERDHCECGCEFRRSMRWASGLARSGAGFCAQDLHTVVFVVDRSQHPPSLREILLFLDSKIQKFEITLRP